MVVKRKNGRVKMIRSSVWPEICVEEETVDVKPRKSKRVKFLGVELAAETPIQI